MLWQGNTLGDWLQKSGTRNTQVVKYIEVFSNDISNLATHESIPMTIMPEGRIVWFGGGGGSTDTILTQISGLRIERNALAVKILEEVTGWKSGTRTVVKWCL